VQADGRAGIATEDSTHPCRRATDETGDATIGLHSVCALLDVVIYQ